MTERTVIRACTLVIAILLLSAAFSGAAVKLQNVTFQTKDAGKVVFSHAVHMGHKNMASNCKVCHYGIYNLKKKSHFTMADMAQGKSCGACHNSRDAFDLKNCSRCHQTRPIVYQVKATGATRFSHKKHLASSPNCNRCHPSLFAAGSNKRATMADMEKGKSCGACHDGKKAFGVDRCTTCHPVREIVFKVRETGLTVFKHAQHIESHNCSDCHIRLYGTKRRGGKVSMAEMEKGKSCGGCHNGKDGFPLKDCAKCHPTRELSFEVKEAGNVAFSHKFHGELYKCGECHTALFSTSRGAARVSMKEMEKGKSCGACHDGKSAFPVKDACDKCHKM